MKTHVKWCRMLLLTTLVWTMSGMVGLADEEGARPFFVWNYDESIKPAMMDAYMKARADDAKLSAEYKFTFPYLTFVSDSRVFTSGVFGSFGQLDGFPQMMEAWNEKTGGKSKQIEQRAVKCVSTCSTSIGMFRPDLSYTPREPAFVPDFSQPFYHRVVIYHIKPDQYEQAQTIARKLKQAHEQKQIARGYLVLESLCGPEVPAFVVLLQAKDKAAFVSLDEKLQENPDEDIEKIKDEGSDVVASTETTEWTYVPEASYVPEGTF